MPILANPPFGHGRHQSATGTPEELGFLESAMAMLEPRGRCGIVVPDGVLFRDERPFRRVRERLLTEFAVIGIVRLPVGIFASAPSVRTNLLFFERGVVRPDFIRYYQVRVPDNSLSWPASVPGTLESAIAWMRRGTPDRYAWEVHIEAVMCGDWSLDIPWPGEHDDHGSTASGKLHLPEGAAVTAVQTSTSLAPWIERRGIRAGSQIVDRLLGVSKDGIAPFKGDPAPDASRCLRVEYGDFTYNPMRVALGSIALCQDASEEGWVSPAYVVFRLTGDAPFSDRHLLDFLKSPVGMTEVDRHSHGSVRKRLRFKDLGQIQVPMPLL